MASICSCENASNAAWATRASATSCSTLLGVVELDFLRPPPTAYSAVGLTMSGFLRVGARNGSADRPRLQMSSPAPRVASLHEAADDLLHPAPMRTLPVDPLALVASPEAAIERRAP